MPVPLLVALILPAAWRAPGLAARPSRSRTTLAALSAADPPRIIRVRNVPFEADVSEVTAIAKRFGMVEHVWLAPFGRASQNHHRGYGRVTFASPDAARDALGCGALELRGRTVLLETEAQQEPEPPPKRARTRRRERPPSHHRQMAGQVATGQRRADLLRALEQSRFRDFATARDYQRTVTSTMAQLGRLVSAEEYAIVIGASGRSRDPRRCLQLLA